MGGRGVRNSFWCVFNIVFEKEIFKNNAELVNSSFVDDYRNACLDLIKSCKQSGNKTLYISHDMCKQLDSMPEFVPSYMFKLDSPDWSECYGRVFGVTLKLNERERV